MKRLTVFLAMMMAAQVANAQMSESRSSMADSEVSSSRGVLFQPTLGVASMTIRDDRYSAGTDQGLSVGSFLEIGGGRISLQTGLLFNQFGSKATDGGDKSVLALDYLSIPVLAKINFAGNADKTAYFKAGLMPSLLMSAKQKIEISGVKRTTDVKSQLNSTDFPLMIGFGGAFPVSTRTSMFVEATYVRSLSKIVKDADTQIRNDGFMLNTGISL